MKTDDNVAIDVLERSEDAAADRAQDAPPSPKVDRETSPTRSLRKASPSRRKFNHVWLGVICGAAAVLALGFGLGFGLNNNGTFDVSAVGATASDMSAADTTIMTSSELTGEMQKEEPKTIVTPGVDGSDPQIGRNSEEEEARENSNDLMETESEPTSPAAPMPRFYSTSPSDPIQVQLRTIDPTIMDGYGAGDDGCADLYEDIYNATLLVANEEIKRIAKYYDRYAQKWPSGGGGGGAVFADLELEMVDATMASVVSAPSAPSAEIKAPAPAMDSAGGENINQEDSFGSNNQEEGVDEADVVKSDGTYVYMAYGDLLLVTDAITGKELSRTQMPRREEDQKDVPPLYPEPYPGPIGPILTPVAVEEISEVDGGGTSAVSKEEEVMPPMRKADESNGDRRHLRHQGKKPHALQKHRRESMWIPPNPKPRISSLLHDAESNRLAVIVSGYGDGYRYNYLDGPILRDQDDVIVRLYDTSSIPTDGKPLSLITSKKMGGGYRSARMIGSTAHIAVQSGVEWHRHITRYLDRWQVVYDGLNKTEYISTASEQAKIAADKFATRLVRELKQLVDNNDEVEDDCSGVTKIALFTAFEDDEENGEDILPSALSSGGALNSYLQITSFDMHMYPQWNAAEAATDSPPVMAMKTAGSFFPTSHSDIYASKDFIVASGRGYIRRSSRSWDDSTYLLTFGLSSDGAAPSGRAIGRVPGYLLNQFSVDEYNGYLRVATTSQAQWGCIDEPILEPMEDGDILIERPCKWGELRPSSSQVTVLKIPGEDDTSRKLEVVGVADGLGKTEVIFSCRFFNDKAYVVTFRRTDPLYALDLSDPKNPIVTDELKISGFSSYLHPIGDDRLLAIGREADEDTGRVTGFQITLFDVSDMNNTSVLQRYTLEEQWSSSTAENDHLAFRYLPRSNLLLIPLSIRGIYDKRDPFDGFTVYYVDPSGAERIEPRFSVSMVDDPSSIRYGCWYDAYMPARTLVFRGNATFVKGHGSVSYTLGDAPTQRWYHNFDDDRDKTSGCFSYWR